MRVDLLTRWEKESDQLSSLFSKTLVREGGQGSGNFGHAGRPGLEGGSAKESPYDYQDSHAEKVIHSQGWGDNNYRTNLMDAGDIFRGFASSSRGWTDGSYIMEKVGRLQTHMGYVKRGYEQMFGDDLNYDKVDELRNAYSKQPFVGSAQKLALELIDDLLEGRVDAAIGRLSYFEKNIKTLVADNSTLMSGETASEIGTDDSGHRGHKGRLGHRGGSLPKSGPKVVEPKGLEPRAGTTYGLQPSWNRLQRIEFIKSKLKIRVRDVKLQDAEQHLNTGVMDEIRTKTAVMLERQPDRVIESFLRKGKIEYMWGEGNYDREERAFYRTFNQGRFGSEKVTKGIGAFFRSANNTMVFRLSDTHNFEYFTHELAHFAIDQSVREYIWREAYQGGIPNFDRMTEYSKKNYQEGFAETYFHWINTGRGTVSDYDRDAHLAQAISVIQTVIDGVKR